MDRIPSAMELNPGEFKALRGIVAASFTPIRQVLPQQRTRLLELGLITSAMGGLIPTPAGRMVSRL